MSRIMNSALTWIDFWHHHLPPDSRVVIEDYPGRQISGELLWKASESTAAHLRKTGCLAGTVIATTNSGFLLVRDLLAAARWGAILHPISSKLLVERGHFSPRHMLLLQEDNVSRALNQPETSYPADTVLLLNTSGSVTGTPATIPLTGAGLIAQLVNHGELFSADWERTRLSLLPHHHAFGLVLDLLLGVYMRQRVICSPELTRTPYGLLQTLNQRKIGVVALVPRLLELLSRKITQHPDGHWAIADLHIHAGGAPIRPPLRTELMGWLRKLTIGYGLTEAGPGVLIDGIPTGCKIKIIDPGSGDLMTSPSQKEGILWVRSQSLSPALATDSEGYFCTNDLAICVENRIEVIGRAGPAIKDSNGSWVPLSSIEHELLRVPNVMGARIVADQGILKVYIITNNNANEDSKLSRFIKSALRRRITRETRIYCQPFTGEHESELSAASSKGMEAMFRHIKDVQN